VSVSSDGRLLFWDARNLHEVVDTCLLTDGAEDNGKIVGGVSLEWMVEAGPAKFLIGSERGEVISCSRKPKKTVEIASWFGHEEMGGHGKHYGPVYACKRNPFHTKFFLTVGDWSAKLWMEDLRSPLLQTPYAPSYLSTGNWSPTRAGVFLLARRDGWLDIWDYYQKMNESACSQKVADKGLTSMSLHSHGALVAVGDAEGTIKLLRLCDSLFQPGHNEKQLVSTIFDREAKRERNLEQISRLARTAPKDVAAATQVQPEIDEAQCKADEESFLQQVELMRSTRLTQQAPPNQFGSTPLVN